MKLITPQLATDAMNDTLIFSPEWVVQEKMDGKRLLIISGETGALTFLNRTGVATTVPAGTRLPNLPPSSILDTEFIWATKVPCVLDLLAWDGEVWTQKPMLERYLEAQRILPSGMTLVACAASQDAKTALIARLQAEQAEGIILKHALSPHTPGRPSIGGACQRMKWKKRADVLICRRADAKRSFDMFLKGASPVHVGSVTAHGFYERLTPDTVAIAEVEYLYASASNRLIQPTIIRLRTDKLPEHCTLDQLVLGKRFATAA